MVRVFIKVCISFVLEEVICRYFDNLSAFSHSLSKSSSVSKGAHRRIFSSVLSFLLAKHLLDKLDLEYSTVAVIHVGQAIGRSDWQLLVDVNIEVVVRRSHV